MGKLLVTARGTFELEFEVDEATWPVKDELSAHAREKWYAEAADATISVTIEPAEWADSGRFGTGPDQTEEDMLARFQREAEEAAGLV